MLIKRCATLYIEPREDIDLDLSALFSGVGALGATVRWVALAPHLGQEVGIDAEELAALGTLGPTLWVEREACERRFGADPIARLLASGLLIGDDEPGAAARERDEALRAAHWHPLAALTHAFTRWEDVAAETGSRFPTFNALETAFGAPPPPAIERSAQGDALALPAAQTGPLDATLLNRYTGRNYDREAQLPLAVLARLLQRTFGAQRQLEMGQGALMLKKTSPSGGSMHPVEAYVLVQRVEGVAPGMYHYHCLNHTLEPIERVDAERAYALAFDMVADQEWFASAPVQIVLAARVERNFWKYRNHAKAYRALQLDAGHLSQTFYLLATEAGLPAFITAAINEIQAERAFGLDPLKDAVIAICGCGRAAEAAPNVEFRYRAA